MENIFKKNFIKIMHVSYQQCLLEREFADGGFHCVITLGRQMLGTNAKSLSGQTSILSLSCIKNVLYKDKGMFHVFVAKSWGDGGFFSIQPFAPIRIGCVFIPILKSLNRAKTNFCL